MMGTTAEVKSFERVKDDNGFGVDVKVDSGGDNLTTAEHCAPCGIDCPPLPGDFAALIDAAGEGSQAVGGYIDSKNEGKAFGGEVRLVARAPDGSVAVELWFHGDGLVEITSLKPGGKYKIGKVQIDENGNLTTPGEITAKAGTAGLVTLSGHQHGSGTGPTTAPIPGM